MSKNVQRRTGVNLRTVLLFPSTGDEEGIKCHDTEEMLDGKRVLRVIKYLRNFEVPIVMASGNNEDESHRTIYVMPQVLENREDVPPIKVRAAKNEAYIWPDTQTGTEAEPQLTIYAPEKHVANKGKTYFQ